MWNSVGPLAPNHRFDLYEYESRFKKRFKMMIIFMFVSSSGKPVCTGNDTIQANTI